METIIPIILKVFSSVSGAGIPIFLLKSKKEEKTPIDIFNDAYKTADPVTDTYAQEHTKAFVHAVDKVLTADDGKVYFSRFDEGFEDSEGKKYSAEKVRDMFRDKLVDYHVENSLEDAIKDHVKGLNKMQQKMFVEALTGYNGRVVEQLMDQMGSNFKHDQYMARVIPQFKGELKSKLQDAAGSHFEDGHIDDIVKYALGDIDVEGKPTLGEAKQLLAAYHDGSGHVNNDSARAIFGKRFKGRKKK